MTMYNSYLVALVIKCHIAAVVGVGAQSSLVLNLSCAVANVEGDFFVLGPDLVSVAPPTRVATRVVLQKKEESGIRVNSKDAREMRRKIDKTIRTHNEQ